MAPFLFLCLSLLDMTLADAIASGRTWGCGYMFCRISLFVACNIIIFGLVGLITRRGITVGHGGVWVDIRVRFLCLALELKVPYLTCMHLGSVTEHTQGWVWYGSLGMDYMRRMLHRQKHRYYGIACGAENKRLHF